MHSFRGMDFQAYGLPLAPRVWITEVPLYLAHPSAKQACFKYSEDWEIFWSHT